MDYAVPLLVAAIAASASVAAAWISSRTRRENASQHGESQRLLVNLADKVDGHGRKVDQLGERIESVAARVDHAHTRIDNHKRRWFR